MLYLLFRLLARVILRLFFRRIEVENRADVPATGAVLFVPNHVNALVDPLLLLITLDRRITLTAKNVLSKNPLLGLLFAGLGVVTFHRREDVGKGADPQQNIKALERCRAILAGGGALCIFPEGVSHSDPQMRPFHSGAARLALDFVKEPGHPPLQIIPVGLLYADKDRFRSGVWLRYGPALDVSQWLTAHPGAGSRELTDEIRHQVVRITHSYESRRENLILVWGAEIVATQGTAPPPLGGQELSVAQWFELLRRLQDGYRDMQASRPAEVEALTARIRRYRSELKRRNIIPAEVFLPIHAGKALFFAFREVELLLIGSPLALLGALNHFAPYLIVRGCAHALSTDKDHWATNVVYPSFLVFPLFYVLQIGAAWLIMPALWALIYSLALPYTGVVAILYGDRLMASWRRLRTFIYFLRHPTAHHELVREGRAIIAAIQQLRDQLPPEGLA